MGADLQGVQRIADELEGLAHDSKPTMTRYLELSMQAARAADGDISALYDVMAFVERVQPDFDRLREINDELERLERSGAMTPLRYSSALEQARIAVGTNGSRFVEEILSTGLERHFVEEVIASFEE